MFPKLLLILTLLSASGCTRTEPAPAQPEPAAPAPAVTQPAADTRPAIVAFGDSLSEGTGVGPGQAFPEVLQKLLDDGGYNYRVVNMGIAGDTTTGGVGRIESVVSVRPEIVLLELGGNDGLRGLPVTATRANLEQIISRLRKENIRVVLAGMSLPPNYGAAYIRAFEKMYRDLASEHKLTLIPFLFEDIATQLARRPELMQRDGIHPSPAGHRLMAETVFRYMKPALRRG